MYKLDNVEEETEVEEKKEGLVLIFKNNIKYSYILNDPQLYHFFEHVFVMFLSKKFKNLEIINAITSQYMVTCYFSLTKKINENNLFEYIKDILTNKIEISDDIFEIEGSRVYTEILSKPINFYDSIYPAGVGVNHKELKKKKFEYKKMFESIYGIINNFDIIKPFYFDWYKPINVTCPTDISIPLNLLTVQLSNKYIFYNNIIIPFEYEYSFVALGLLSELSNYLDINIMIRSNYNFSYFTISMFNYSLKSKIKFYYKKIYIEYVIEMLCKNFFIYMQDVNTFQYKKFNKNELEYIELINNNKINLIREKLSKEINDIICQITNFLKIYLL